MRFPFRGLRFYGRLPASDYLLFLFWLSGVVLGCATAAVCETNFPYSTLVRRISSDGFFPALVPILWLIFSFEFCELGFSDIIFFLLFAKGFIDTFILCLLLSASECLGWISLLIAFGRQLLLVPLLIGFWRYLLRNYSKR